MPRNLRKRERNMNKAPDNEADPATKSKQSAGESLYNLENASSKELLQTYKDDSLSLILKKRYELLWHKQITADTYSRILRRAYDARTRGWDRIRQRYYRLIGAKRKYNRVKWLDMNFYQNDFNYVFTLNGILFMIALFREERRSQVLPSKIVNFLRVDLNKLTSNK